jgi:hypothetical protein
MAISLRFAASNFWIGLCFGMSGLAHSVQPFILSRPAGGTTAVFSIYQN